MADPDDDELEENAEEDAPVPAAPAGGVFGRFRRPSGTNGATPQTLSEREKEVAIRTVDPTERKVGYIAAGLMALAGLVALVPHIEHPKQPVVSTAAKSGNKCPSGYELVHKVCTSYTYHSKSDWIIFLVVIMVLALCMALATKIGRRSMVAFSLLIGGLAVSSLTGGFIGLAFLFAGGWLLLRSYRMQKYGTTSAKEVAELNARRRAERRSGSSTASKTSGTTTAGKAPAKSTRSSKGSKGAATNGTERPKPQASKRYTPKSAPKKRPVPPPT